MASAWSIGGVTLEYAPKRVEHTVTAAPKEIQLPGAYPLLLLIGKGSRVLSLEGSISAPGQDASALETTLNNLVALIGTQVTVVGPNTRYDGANWIVTKFTYTEEGGYTVSFKYSMELMMGSDQVIV